MYEAVRNLAMLVWAVSAINYPSYAQERAVSIAEETSPATPTMIYGAAKQADGSTDWIAVEQGAGSANPFGNPIPAAADDGLDDEKLLEVPQLSDAGQISDSKGEPQNLIRETSSLGSLQPGQVPLPQPAAGQSSRIENEMYEADGNIVDVQEYPLSDVEKMTRQVNPATLVNQPH